MTAVAGCGDAAPSVNVDAIEAFAFVRDEASIVSPGQRRQAERELREVARRTGVFGVLVTADEPVDPPIVYRPIFAEVTALGGEALMTICTREMCGPASGAAHTDGLADAVAMVGFEPTPPGAGRRNVNRAIRDWLEYVAAVAAATADR